MDEDIPVYIFSAATTMVGICLTVIGVLSIDAKLRHFESGGGFLLSMDSVAFLVSGILAYIVLRTRKEKQFPRLMRATEVIFSAAILLTVVICILLAYEFI